jgi:hypothetical protein
VIPFPVPCENPHAMKEDVLEQIVDDYLQFEGYFMTHNVRFQPSKEHALFVGNQDRVSSDVDVVGYHPHRTGVDRVMVVTCKPWQAGFNPGVMLAELREDKGNPNRETWRLFRELWIPKWSEAFRDAIKELTGESTFSYRIAVTRLRGAGDPNAWAEDPTIKANLGDCSFGFLTLEEMWKTMLAKLRKTPAASEVGRLAQLLKAAGLTAPTVVAPPSPPAPGSDAANVEEREKDL